MRSLIKDAIVKQLYNRAYTIADLSEALGTHYEYTVNSIRALALAGHITRDGINYYCLPSQHRRYFSLPYVVRKKAKPVPTHDPLHNALYDNK